MLHAVDVASDLLEGSMKGDVPIEAFLAMHERVVETYDEMNYRARLYLGQNRFEHQ